MKKYKYNFQGKKCLILEENDRFSTLETIDKKGNKIQYTYPNALLFDDLNEQTPSEKHLPDFFDTVIGFDFSLSYRIKDFYVDFINGKYDLNPPYQRNFVWTLEQQQAYIQALLDEKTKLECYAALEINRTKAEYYDIYEVIDGKQRLTTVVHFIENKFPLASGKFFKELNNTDRLDFLSSYLGVYRLSTRDFHRNLTNQEKLEVFLMINEKGTRLTEDEINNAKKALTNENH